MKFFRTAQVKEIDAFTIANEPVSSADLMERAAGACTEFILSKITPESRIFIFAGPGNNGGDAWAIARLLIAKGFRNIHFFLLKISNSLSPDSELNRKRLTEQGVVRIQEINQPEDFPGLNHQDIIIDGIFGSGLTRPVTGLAAECIQHLNRAGATVFSIDIPSGLFGEDNRSNEMENVIRATYTLSFQFPKLSFFFRENSPFVGNWIILPIGLYPDAIRETPSGNFYLTPADITGKIKKRDKFSHKGTYGNALLIAGSYGMMGAAVISAKACLRTGAGLVTAHIPAKGVEIMQSAFPESLISIDESDEHFSALPDLSKFSAVAVGPGLGKQKETREALEKLLEICAIPLVMDADALNIIGENKHLLEKIPKNSILTPHPKEFERIAGKTENSFERYERQKEFAQQYGVYIVLKGAHTSVACPDGSCYFNTTGNPGMATAGSGDVLTGIILGFLSQGFSPQDAAITGVFIHGLAADIAVTEKSEYSMISSDIIEFLGKAFLNLKTNENEKN